MYDQCLWPWQFPILRFAPTNDSIQYLLNDHELAIPGKIWETFEAASMHLQEQQEISLHERIPEVLQNEELVHDINSWRHIYGCHLYYDEHGQTINYQFLFPNGEAPATTETTDGSNTSTIEYDGSTWLQHTSQAQICLSRYSILLKKNLHVKHWSFSQTRLNLINKYMNNFSKLRSTSAIN